MMFRLRTVCLIAAVGGGGAAIGQDGQTPTPTGSPEATTAAKTPADASYESLGRDLSNLHKSLVNKGGIAPEDHAAIRAVRDRAAAFSREFPEDVRGPAAELLLSRWLKDDDLLDSLFARVVALQPENWQARLSWADHLVLKNGFRQILEILAPVPAELLKESAKAKTYADALFAEHRFQETIDALSHLPEASVQVSPDTPSAPVPRLVEAAKNCLSLWPEELSRRHQEEAAADLPRVLVVTERGQITLELFENEAPNTVANFINLIDQGFYNQTRFHRVIGNFMAQGGDPNSKPGSTGVAGEGNPGYYIPDEHDREDHRNHFTGSLSMAKTAAPNTAGSQFFITVTPTPHLNGKHTVFGRVIEGLEVVRAIKQDDEIELMTVVKRREHDYKPTTLPLVEPAPPPPPAATSTEEPPAAPPVIPPPAEVPPTDPATPPQP